jgi:hypothetical protein
MYCTLLATRKIEVNEAGALRSMAISRKAVSWPVSAAASRTTLYGALLFGAMIITRIPHGSAFGDQKLAFRNPVSVGIAGAYGQGSDI